METDPVKVLEEVGVPGAIKKRARKVEAPIEACNIRKIAKYLSSLGARFVIIAAADVGLDIELVYHFDFEGNIVALKTSVPKEAPEIDSIKDIVPGADWAEREASDLFGVRFRGGSDRSLLLSGDLKQRGPPLARAFRLLPSEVAPVAESIASVGATAPLTPLMERRRQEAGLAPKAGMVYASEGGSRELTELMKRSGFTERGGFDPDRKKLRGVYK